MSETIWEERPNTTQSIELDCPPGHMRPWELIVAVCEGTGLPVTDDVVACFFGHSEWYFEMPREEWVERIVPIIRPRIERLYNTGAIRYGSW